MNRIRIILDPSVGEAEFTALAASNDWSLYRQIAAVADGPRVDIFSTKTGSSEMHWVEDTKSGVHYMLVKGTEAEAIAALLRAQLKHYTSEDILARARDRSLDVVPRRLAVLHLAIDKMGPFDQETFDIVAEAMRHAHAVVRQAGVIAAAFLMWPQLVPPLLALTNADEKEHTVRADAARFAEAIEPGSMARAPESALFPVSLLAAPETRREAINTIADAVDAAHALDDRTAMAVVETLGCDDADARGTAEYVLQTDAERYLFGPGVNAIRLGLTHTQARVRRIAAKILTGFHARAENGAEVARMLAVDDHDALSGALAALNSGALPRAQKEDVVNALVPLLAHSDLATRKEALWALYLMGEEGAPITPAVPALQRAFEDPDMKRNATIALAFVWVDDPDRLQPLLQHADEAIRVGAAWGMASAYLLREDLAGLKRLFASEQVPVLIGLGRFLFDAKKRTSIALAGDAYAALKEERASDAQLIARMDTVIEIVRNGPLQT